MNLTHLDEKGNVRMVDVSSKEMTLREAVASGRIRMKTETLRLIMSDSSPKGDVIATARIAGITAAKQTSSLIPMCHQVPLDEVRLEFLYNFEKSCVDVKAIARCTWKTGVEMEALVASSVAALTIYDMCKAVDKDMIIEDVKLLEKSGGKSGHYVRKTD